MSAVEVRDLFRVYSTPEGHAAALQGLTLSVQEKEVPVVRERYSARRLDERRPRSASKTCAVPAEGRSSPARTRSSVDFPDPLGPRTTSISFSCTESVRP